MALVSFTADLCVFPPLPGEGRMWCTGTVALVPADSTLLTTLRTWCSRPPETDSDELRQMIRALRRYRIPFNQDGYSLSQPVTTFLPIVITE